MARRLHTGKEVELFFDLINAFSLIKDSSEGALFLQDIFTAKELINLSRRLRIAKLILAGNTQRDIAFGLGCSIATVTKVSSWLNQRGDGFKSIVVKLPSKYPKPKKLPRGPIEYYLPQTIAGLTQYYLEKNQSDKVKAFIDEMDQKKRSDKELQESFKDKYRK